MLERITIDVNKTGHITNCYIVWDEDSNIGAIVDPADDFEKIDKYITDKNINLKYVLLTHGHGDHVLALSQVMNKYNVKVIVHENELNMITGKINNYSIIFRKTQDDLDISRIEAAKDNDVIELGEIKLQVLYTPGHSSGSACYLNEKEKTILTGDTLFSDCFGRCDLVTSDIEEMKLSLKRLYTNYSDYRIYPGHGEEAIVKDTYEHVKKIMGKVGKNDELF